MTIRTVRGRRAAGLLALSTLLATELPAQFPGRGPASGMGYLAVGAQRVDLTDLNQRTTAAGYPPFAEDMVSFGIGAFRMRERVLLGLEGHGMGGPSRTTADGALRARATAGHMLFDVGYAAFAGRRAAVYPILGLGAGATTLEISERSAPSFDDVLRQPRRSVRMATPSLLIDPSIGFDYRLTARPGTRATRGLALGLRVGHGFAFMDREWIMDTGTDLPGGPAAGVQGPYARLTVGRWIEGRRR
jgi:hypothetical protein